MHTIQFLSSLVCEWALELTSRAQKEKKFLWIHAGTRACAADVDVKVAPRKRSRKKWRKKIRLQERTMAKTGLTTFSTFIAGLVCCSWLSRNAKLVQWGRARWCWFGVFGPQVLSEITFYAFRSFGIARCRFDVVVNGREGERERLNKLFWKGCSQNICSCYAGLSVYRVREQRERERWLQITEECFSPCRASVSYRMWVSLDRWDSRTRFDYWIIRVDPF